MALEENKVHANSQPNHVPKLARKLSKLAKIKKRVTRTEPPMWPELIVFTAIVCVTLRGSRGSPTCTVQVDT